MSITGNLNTMQVAELLQWLSQSGKTGTLAIDSGEVEKKIFFKLGRIFSTSSTDPKEYLGHFLVSHGFISELELVKAMEMQESNQMLLGKILVTIGAISEADLRRLLKLKAEESIYDLFSWEEADFRFYDGQLPEANLVPIDLDVTALILEGARRSDEWTVIRDVVPSLHSIPVWVGDLTDPGIPAGDRQILELVDDARTVEEICMETHSSEYRVCSVLYQQVAKERLKVVRPRWPERDPSKEAMIGPVSAERLAERGRELMKRKDYGLALRHFRAGRILEPDNKQVEKALAAASEEMHQALDEAGVSLEAVPKLNVSMEDLTNLDLTPQEGFILTRIDDSYDLKSILKISPMPQLEGLLVFWRLIEAGHVRLE